MLSVKQKLIIGKAAILAHEANIDDDMASFEFFVQDYTEAMNSGNKAELASLYFAIASLGIEKEARELTGLTELEAERILLEEATDSEKSKRNY